MDFNYNFDMQELQATQREVKSWFSKNQGLRRKAQGKLNSRSFSRSVRSFFLAFTTWPRNYNYKRFIGV